MINDQFNEIRAEKNGLASENYRRLLEMVLTIENKIKQTNQNLIGDLKQEFMDTLNTREQSLLERQHDTNEQIVKQQDSLNSLKGVKSELEMIIKSRSVAT